MNHDDNMFFQSNPHFFGWALNTHVLFFFFFFSRVLPFILQAFEIASLTRTPGGSQWFTIGHFLHNPWVWKARVLRAKDEISGSWSWRIHWINYHQLAVLVQKSCLRNREVSWKWYILRDLACRFCLILDFPLNQLLDVQSNSRHRALNRSMDGMYCWWVKYSNPTFAWWEGHHYPSKQFLAKPMRKQHNLI